MDRLDDGGELYELFVDGGIALPSGKENKRRADPFSAGVHAIFDVAADFGFKTVDLGYEKSVKGFQMRL